ncbi:hypothetical protein [Pseudomonas serbica]|jgi:hypothetical protein|uniref:hypothetical protein n=1 Tax=Pseudomonas serbica TaxID=2965074 RepID=UPI00237B054F|nr:hypothetical protein [Pseudomonas serbica]
MFDDKEMLYQIALEHPVHRCMLPDRFLLDATRDRVWSALLGGKAAIRDLAQRLRKSSHIEAVPREARRRMADEAIIAMLMVSHEARTMLTQTGTLNPEEWHDIIFNGQTKALSGKTPKTKNWALKLENYDFELTRGSVEKAMLELLHPYTDVDFYRGLGQTEKDCADFVINVSLCNLMSIDLNFVSDFLEQYQFLMERQTAFAMGVTRAVVEGGSPGAQFDILTPPTDMPYPLYWRGCLKVMHDMTPSKGQEMSFRNLILNADVLLSLTTNESHGICSVIRNRMESEEQLLLKGLSRLGAEVEESGLQVAQETWKYAIDTLESLPPLPAFPPLSKKLLNALERYTLERSDICRKADPDPDAFISSLYAIKDIKVAITEEISKSNTDVSKITELTTQLSEQTTMFQTSAAQFGDMYTGVLKVCLDLREKLKEFAENKAPEAATVPTPEPEATPEAQEPAYPDLREELKQSEQEKLTLNDKLSSQVQLNVSNSTLIDKLTSELTECRGNNHKLKQRLNFLPKVVEEPEIEAPLPLDLFKKIITGGKPSPLEVLTFFEMEAQDRVVVLPSAKVSADEANDYKHGYRLAGLVQRLIYPYFDAIQSGNADSVARKILGDNYAAKESQGVEQSRSLRSQREFYYNGEPHYFERHLTLGRNYGTADSVRLYFDIIDGKVVIAYCGKHLDSVQTN